MTDLSLTIAPKSDQLNADDLIAGPLTIRVTRLSANQSAPEQPISIFYEGDNGKPYKPCKSMRRVLVHTWGANGNEFAGRAMTLYRDPTVRFGGFETGGIRISHLSHIDKPVTMALTATRASRKPYTVAPLQDDEALCRAAAQKGLAELQATWKSLGGARQRPLAHMLDEFKQIATQPPASTSAPPSVAAQAGLDSSAADAPDMAEESTELDAPTAFARGETDREAGASIFDVPADIKAAGLTDAWKQGWNRRDSELTSETTNRGA